MKVINKKEFEELVINSKGVVLVDFFANWCGPCKMLAPVLEQVANDVPECKIYKVDVDEEEALAMSYKVQSIPNLVLFVDGKPVETSLGYKPKEQLVNWIKSHL